MKPKNISPSIKLIWFCVAISMMHHADHILRIDHSGWPLLPQASPFTYSLLVYPIFISIFFARPEGWYRVAATGLLFSFATIAHIFFEPMRDKYHTWAYGSNLPRHTGEQNMLGFNSKILGVCSIGIAVLLSIALLITLISLIKDVRSHKPMRGLR